MDLTNDQNKSRPVEANCGFNHQGDTCGPDLCPGEVCHLENQGSIQSPVTDPRGAVIIFCVHQCRPPDRVIKWGGNNVIPTSSLKWNLTSNQPYGSNVPDDQPSACSYVKGHPTGYQPPI